MTPGRRARRAVAEILCAYMDCKTTDDREQVALAIARLTPHGARPLADLANEAMAETKRENEK